MPFQGNTRESRSFDEWMADRSAWWDMTRGEEACDQPWLPWRSWYEEGLSVEAAVGRANTSVFGG